jgi:4-carboxymuconolactone decarboxylase
MAGCERGANAALVSCFAVPTFAQSIRLPAIPPASYDDAQKKAAAEFEAAIKRPPYGPFEKLMYSSEVMVAAREMGSYLRHKSAIGTTSSELVILVTARELSQDFEWSSHAPIALEAGIAKAIVDAIADGRRPQGMSTDDEICYDFSIELLRNKRVSDAAYERAKSRFGDKGVLDLAAISGYYTFIAMVLNTARVPAREKLSRFPDWGNMKISVSRGCLWSIGCTLLVTLSATHQFRLGSRWNRSAAKAGFGSITETPSLCQTGTFSEFRDSKSNPNAGRSECRAT